MLYNYKNCDFKYASFPLSLDALESYVQSAITNKKTVKGSKDSYSHSGGVVDCIISCIASNEFSFDKNNKRVFKALYTMLRDYAHDNGKYTDEARNAMRILCSYCGFPEDSIVLTDRKPMGRMARLKQKVSGWFGYGDPKDAQEDKIDQMFNTVAQQKSRAKHDALVAEAEKRRAEMQRLREENEKKRIAEAERIREEAARRATTKQESQKKTEKHTETVPAKANDDSKKTKHNRFSVIGATITGVVALGAAMLFGSHNSADMTSSTVDNNNEPTFKNIYVDQSSHYDNVSTYNMIDSLKKQKSNLDSLMQYRAPSVVKSEQVAQEKQTVQTSEDKDYADAVTDASRSALNILIGAERAQELYHDICVKVKAGIFNLPDGMSVERVAHAMEMSRIYEGHSVILDALNSDVKLTVEQQKAFNDHIASIGDLGVKLQKRMAKQHNLNQHSRYDKAGKDFQRAHAKNLKQLRQIKNRMR